MKVCFISHSRSTKGGAEKALLELIDALRVRGVEVCVILPREGSFAEELKKRRISYYVIPYRWWMSKNSPLWKRIARTILNFAVVVPITIKILRWKCDIVYTNTITVCSGALAAKFLRKPHIWHIHEFGFEDHGLAFDFGSKFSLWLMNHFSTICIANSYAVAKKYRQYINPSKLKVVYQSVSVPQDVPAEKVTTTPNVEIRCVIVGTLQEGKRQEDAIRAIGELVKKGVKAKLYIIGEGNPEYESYLRNLVAKNKLDNYIEFVGYSQNPFSFMKSADVLLMCSRYEAFGRVTVEAMKLGKPVIGARSGGTTELIRDGFNGFLYTPGNYEELAEKIKYLYEHPDIKLQMGANAFKWASERFTQDRYGEEVLSILKKVIDGQT